MNGTAKVAINTQCVSCGHKEVCSYMETYKKILKAISDAPVELLCNDLEKVQFKRVADFNFINRISVDCGYYQNWTDTYRDGGNTTQLI